MRINSIQLAQTQLLAKNLSALNAKMQLQNSRSKNTDQLEVSSLAQELANHTLPFQIDLEKFQSNNIINFSYQSTVKAGEFLSLSGSVREEKYISLHIEYEQFESSSNGASMAGKRFILDFEGSFNHQISTSSFLQKEDILTFLQKIIKRIQDTSMENRSSVISLVFDNEDLREIAGIKKGEILKMLYQFIESLNMLVLLRKQNEKNQDIDFLVLNPKRNECEGTMTTEEQNASLSLTVKIEELADKNAVSQQEENDSPTSQE
ncbi:MAG TPA: hypothetical protein PK595_02240 [Bacteroidota bacterium]|nr:hypothetical protein [Bacteroidota bacterium]